MKFYLSLIICTLINYTVCAQYRVMTKQEMSARKFKILKTDFSNAEVLHAYMSAFDENYRSYYRNEFELNKNEAKYKNQIQNFISNINEEEIFYHDPSNYTTFGEYDFTNSKFKFDPFKEYEEENGNKARHVEVYGERDDYVASEVLIKNLNFVNGLPMSNDAAENLIKSRTSSNSFSSNRIDRTIYIRIYYAVHTDKTTKLIPRYSFGGTEDDECLYGEPLRVEVWGDKCRANELLAVYYPNRNNLSAKFYTLSDKLRSEKIENKYIGHVSSDNFKSIISWSTFNKECEREEFEMHIKLESTTPDDRILSIRLFTNYDYNIKPGFSFSFYNKETNAEYPLVIYEAKSDKNVTLKIKVTRPTLVQIVNSNCYCFRLQLNGDPKYSLPGDGISQTGNPVSTYKQTADFYLGERDKATLFSILNR